MKCAWQELLSILPAWISREVDAHCAQSLQELRLRRGQPPELICKDSVRWMNREVALDDLNFCINTASHYSPWAAQTLAQGYLTAPGGHRIGLCGEAVVQNGKTTGIRNITSLNIRVARDFPGIAHLISKLKGSILLLGPPGSGKTTLLRDLIRQISETETVGVVDERGELFPAGLERGKRMDVLTGCSKREGLEMVLRTMGPSCIASDEITAEEDCEALQMCGWCGVRLLASAHAASMEDLRERKLYLPLIRNRLFDHYVVLSRDKSWHTERMVL